MQLFLREKAFIGDAILALHARDWALKRFPCRHLRAAFYNEVVTNRTLSAFARHVLWEPKWGGTGMEAHLYDIREEFGPEAAKAMVERICVWCVDEMNARRKGRTTAIDKTPQL